MSTKIFKQSSQVFETYTSINLKKQDSDLNNEYKIIKYS